MRAKRVTASAFLITPIAAVPEKTPTVLTDNGNQFRLPPREGSEHRFTKIDHPRTSGQKARMNSIITDVTVKRYHHDSRNKLWQHLDDLISGLHFRPRSEILAPYVSICKIWTIKPMRFRFSLIHQVPGPNT